MNRRELWRRECAAWLRCFRRWSPPPGAWEFFSATAAEAAIDHRAACFPAQTEEMVPPTSTPLPKEE